MRLSVVFAFALMGMIFSNSRSDAQPPPPTVSVQGPLFVQKNTTFNVQGNYTPITGSVTVRVIDSGGNVIGGWVVTHFFGGYFCPINLPPGGYTIVATLDGTTASDSYDMNVLP